MKRIQWRSILAAAMSILLLFSLVGCAGVGNNENTAPTMIEEDPIAELNPEYYGDSIVIQDLGRMELESFPVDINYDWKFSVMKENGIYKMWWCRLYHQDAIYYAESTDLKHWVNEQIALEIPNETFYDREWTKVHVGNPSVIKVEGTYYMYFESPATLLETGECDNNVFLATSQDGKTFTMYPNNDDPQPVVRMPEELMALGHYGVGQPEICYKDGTFYLWYTDAIDGNNLRFATSKDGINFGNYEDHPIVFDRSTVGVCYNAAIDKFIMGYTVNPSQMIGGEGSDSIFLNYSDDGIHWEIASAYTPNMENKVSSDALLTRGFPGFVTDKYNHVRTATMYVTYMEAGYNVASGDFRASADTWDGHIVAVNLKEFAKKEIVLPNGNVLNEENLKAYEDSGLTYDLATAVAKYGTPTIDLEKEALWDDTQVLKVNRLSPRWGMEASDTTGELQLLWDENALYIYGTIDDNAVSYSYAGAELYQKDSIDLFINVSNDQKQYKDEFGHTWKDWTVDVITFTICANGQYKMQTTTGDVTNAVKGTVVYTNISSDGWYFEAKIPWYPLVKSKVAENHVIGFEAQINDDPGVGRRRAQIVWNDLRAASFQNLDCLGLVQLEK